MGLLNFVKEAGEKLFHRGQDKPAAAAPAAAPTQADVAKLNQEAGDAIERYVQQLGLQVQGLQVAFDGASSTATVTGQAPDQATKEKVLLAAGNVQGVAGVTDQMTVAGQAQAAVGTGQVQDAAQAPAQFHTVASGDTLSKISAQYYGNANDYMRIFEANKPMLSDPNKIYPGQMLRIPPKQ
ncbi:peptidoglycan-binding protein LysM [Azohydromonas caseinilytica]|uniref:Potassium binding protein Kbp n=1 Tax=Azohydromonas caseinilytica TaxID=2728836 RepID=A0A848FH26_9BURK|nr:peptidoglycan-binding protein LysM [Azohydromonas caseinilytica]NML18446.1 peptidoglycan-binding protein LysM [Azohydromonas caseinilytica]